MTGLWKSSEIKPRALDVAITANKPVTPPSQRVNLHLNHTICSISKTTTVLWKQMTKQHFFYLNCKIPSKSTSSCNPRCWGVGLTDTKGAQARSPSKAVYYACIQNRKQTAKYLINSLLRSNHTVSKYGYRVKKVLPWSWEEPLQSTLGSACHGKALAPETPRILVIPALPRCSYCYKIMTQSPSREQDIGWCSI